MFYLYSIKGVKMQELKDIFEFLPYVSIAVVTVFLFMIFIVVKKTRNKKETKSSCEIRNNVQKAKYSRRAKDIVLLIFLVVIFFFTMFYFSGFREFFNDIDTKFFQITTAYNKKNESYVNLIDILSLILTLVLDVIGFLLTYYIFKKENEFTSSGQIYFDSATVYNIKKSTNNNIVMDIVLKDDTASISQNHEIVPYEITVYICLIKEIFNCPELFNDYKDNTDYCRKIKVNLENEFYNHYTSVTSNAVNFNFKIRGSRDKLKDIFVDQANYEDTKMIVVDIKYQIQRKGVNKDKRTTFDIINQFFSDTHSIKQNRIFFELTENKDHHKMYKAVFCS